jgi:glutamate racemase
MSTTENTQPYTDPADRPIGIFDSGIGGLTVLKEIWNRLPNESTVYFGDSGRYPYGTKSHETIVKYSLQNMRFLLEQNVKMIVIACGSASSHAFEEVRSQAGVPVVEVITPGAEQAVAATRNGRIGIIATRATIGSGVYRRAVQTAAADLIAQKRNTGALSNLYIEETPCPLFVSLAEEGWCRHPAARMVAEEYLSGLRKSRVDVLVLGCTHYPLLADVIGEVMGDGTSLINTGSSVARKVAEVLSGNCMERKHSGSPTHSFYTSDNPGMFEELAAPFFGGGRPSGTKYVVTENC